MNYLFVLIIISMCFYTIENILQNRMWRKNRNTLYTTNCSSDNDLSNGIDLNRNFDYIWMSKYAIKFLLCKWNNNFYLYNILLDTFINYTRVYYYHTDIILPAIKLTIYFLSRFYQDLTKLDQRFRRLNLFIVKL